MKNKILFISIAILSIVSVVFTSCADENVKFREVPVTAVEALYEPEDAAYVNLTSVTAMYFEWELAHSKDNSIVYYDVLFDKVDGDFSNPLYIASSDSRGYKTYATITQKTMNSIAGLAGAGRGEEVTIKWAVRSNRGKSATISEEARLMTISRLMSIEEPDSQNGEGLFITGAGSEDGQQVFKNVAEDRYEIYTHLEAGQPFYFHITGGETDREFNVNFDQGIFEETTGSTVVPTTVATSGEYRMTLDFTTGDVSIDKIDKAEFFLMNNQEKTEMLYDGKGIWKVANHNLVYPATGWSWDPYDSRYKFILTVNGVAEHWGCKNGGDRPSIAQKERFYLIKLAGTGQWDGPEFKAPNEVFDVNDPDRYYADILMIMVGENYTHDFQNIHE